MSPFYLFISYSQRGKTYKERKENICEEWQVIPYSLHISDNIWNGKYIPLVEGWKYFSFQIFKMFKCVPYRWHFNFVLVIFFILNPITSNQTCIIFFFLFFRNAMCLVSSRWQGNEPSDMRHFAINIILVTPYPCVFSFMG